MRREEGGLVEGTGRSEFALEGAVLEVLRPQSAGKRNQGIATWVGRGNVNARGMVLAKVVIHQRQPIVSKTQAGHELAASARKVRKGRAVIIRNRPNIHLSNAAGRGTRAVWRNAT